MSVGRIVEEFERIGVRLWEESGQLRFRAPTGVMTEERRSTLRSRKEELLRYLRVGGEGPLTPDPSARHLPFPLTEVQEAYVLGRRDAFSYGGVGCQVYLEIAFPDLDPPRLEAAWQALILRHDMLRALISADGSQRVLPEVPRYRIRVADLRHADVREAAQGAEAVRSEMDHRSHSPDEWPLFELRVTLTRERALLHLSFDFLVADYMSVQRLLDELHQLYYAPGEPLAPLDLAFRDYLVGVRERRDGAAYQRDRAYWWRRIDDLPPAPELPTAEAAQLQPTFRRWQLELSRDEYAAFRGKAGAWGITASTAILAAYAEVVGRWSRQPRFTLDITLLSRLPLHPQVDQLVGDFTTVDLLAVEPAPGSTLGERARRLQARLWEDMDHLRCSGIEVMRELVRRRGRRAALMPIVFTSAIGVAEDVVRESEFWSNAELVYGISQTPQVWIDCQVMERRGALAVNWDVRDGVFPAGLVDDMFGAFESLLRRLAGADSAWKALEAVALPAQQRERRRRVNATSAPAPAGLLHHAVLEQARRSPERAAVLSGGRRLSYRELLGRAASVASALRAVRCDPQERVAVVMDKGWEQVVGVLGTLLAGAAYVPVDTIQPRARRDRILADGRVRVALTQSWLVDFGDWPSGVTPLAVDTLEPQPGSELHAPAADAGALAYVIYTSGSTGRPKGVMIEHRSALNTVCDINRRFGVDADDRVLGLSNLGFDLSVYDVFGPLSVGGCLVLPDHDRRADPSHWAKLIGEHAVTVWNSVPAQLQMLGHYLASEPGVELPSLKLGLLSGDWIPIGLPDSIRERLHGLELVSLGGATEASIWSIFHRIERVRPEWRSIPYGKPLANQRFHVLDAALRPCPDWTAGELYIGGDGLAQGYLGDPDKTAERFLRHPGSGERLYRTGDLGRYLPDGSIEFLGREDSQVKVRGHRIELAEVEAACQSHPAVAAAAAFVDGERGLERRLVAYVETERRGDDDATPVDDADRIVAASIAGGAEVMTDVDRPRYLDYHRRLDEVALMEMVLALRQAGLFETPGDAHSLEQILSRARVAPQHHRLVRRWLAALVQNGMLVVDPAQRYGGAPRVDAQLLDEAWRRADDLQREVDADARDVHEYFRASGRHLPELLRGDDDPVRLLFPEGRLDVSETLYNVARFNRWANQIAAAALGEIARQRQGDGPLRILEVGAGVGGTSIDVIPALAGFEVDYLFTDLSQGFLNQARERFRDHPWVRFGVFDLDRDYRGQGLAANSFDVILSGDVMHSTRHIGRVLERARELLLPGGWLLVLEMTRDHYQIMTSLELLIRLDEELADFEDDRRGRDQTFVHHEKWLELFAGSGGRVELCLPEEGDALAEIGMYVYGVRFKGDRRRIDAARLSSHLAERLPEYMLPSHLEVVDSLPLTENGKVDRARLRAWLSSARTETAPAGDDAPQGELERTLAEAWSEVLGVKRVGRSQSFFEIGGDSLLGSQLVGLVRERVAEAAPLDFDTILRRLLDGPTLAEFASYLAASAADAEPAGSGERAGGP